MSWGKCARLRENVPYVKIHRYNPKHLYPKLKGYGDNGQRKVWSSCGSTYCTVQILIYVLWVISVYFNVRNILPKSGTFPHGTLSITVKSCIEVITRMMMVVMMMTTIIIMTNGTTSKSIGKCLNKVPGKHLKELERTGTLRYAHILQEVLM